MIASTMYSGGRKAGIATNLLQHLLSMVFSPPSSPPERKSVLIPTIGRPKAQAYPYSKAVPESTSGPSRIAIVTVLCLI